MRKATNTTLSTFAENSEQMQSTSVLEFSLHPFLRMSLRYPYALVLLYTLKKVTYSDEHICAEMSYQILLLHSLAWKNVIARQLLLFTRNGLT